MMEYTTAKIAVGREAGIVPVLDMVVGNVISSLVGAFALATRLVIAPVRKQFMPDASLRGYPHHRPT
ncbi:hypothetical protein BSY16_5665 (plasmid) [Sinorhizobium sp. RAC02]|nr:hypothetical protein BSY16_5665 [Sinorhizobium sp. RAC02]